MIGQRLSYLMRKILEDNRRTFKALTNTYSAGLEGCCTYPMTHVAISKWAASAPHKPCQVLGHKNDVKCAKILESSMESPRVIPIVIHTRSSRILAIQIMGFRQHGMVN